MFTRISFGVGRVVIEEIGLKYVYFFAFLHFYTLAEGLERVCRSKYVVFVSGTVVLGPMQWVSTHVIFCQILGYCTPSRASQVRSPKATEYPHPQIHTVCYIAPYWHVSWTCPPPS